MVLCGCGLVFLSIYRISCPQSGSLSPSFHHLYLPPVPLADMEASRAREGLCPSPGHVSPAAGCSCRSSFPASTVGWLLLQGALTPHVMGNPVPPRPPEFWSVGASQKTGFPYPWKHCRHQTLVYPIVHAPRLLSWEGTPRPIWPLAAGGGLSSSPACMVPPS